MHITHPFMVKYSSIFNTNVYKNTDFTQKCQAKFNISLCYHAKVPRQFYAYFCIILYLYAYFHLISNDNKYVQDFSA